MKPFGLIGTMVLLLLASGSGCRESVETTFVSSAAVQALEPDVQRQLRHELQAETGTYEKPVLLWHDNESQGRLRLGQRVYMLRCVQCHGVSGDGNGPSAAGMYPRPRDYRRGIFKFTSTPYGSKPLRSDLIRTITNGVRGTSMPEFRLLPANELQAVVDYVLFLTRRGELEEQLAYLADSEGKLTPELIKEEGTVEMVISRWKQAQGMETFPMTSQPVFTVDHVKRGKEAFLTKGCSKCHGDDGRGQTPDNLAGNLKDAWGHPTRAADLTSGMLHGGPRPIDIYRRIFNGINGTPMPGFSSALQSEPETIWDLVAYVQYVSSRRRAGEMPPPGTTSPYVPVGTDVEHSVAER